MRIRRHQPSPGQAAFARRKRPRTLPLVQPGQLRQVDKRVPFGHLTAAEGNATGTRDPDLVAGEPRLRRVAGELAGGAARLFVVVRSANASVEAARNVVESATRWGAGWPMSDAEDRVAGVLQETRLQWWCAACLALSTHISLREAQEAIETLGRGSDYEVQTESCSVCLRTVLTIRARPYARRMRR